MPYAPARPCRKPGCPELVDQVTRPSGYCSPHEIEAPRRRADATRGSSSERGYDATWQRVRRAYLDRHPLCGMAHDQARADALGASRCRVAGETVTGSHVDHIDGDASNCAPENLRTLCAPCHNARTMRDQVPRRTSR